MLKCYVYPKKIWNGTKKCLQIQRETEDGSCWFGIEEAINSYCNGNGLDISTVEWCVWCEPRRKYASIKAKDSKEWLGKFEKLKVVWEIAK